MPGSGTAVAYGRRGRPAHIPVSGLYPVPPSLLPPSPSGTRAAPRPGSSFLLCLTSGPRLPVLSVWPRDEAASPSLRTH